MERRDRMSIIVIPDKREFESFGKITRTDKALACVMTEKIDGTNAQIVIEGEKIVAVGSRKRWISPGKATDNYGFAAWVEKNYEELLGLGDGTHFGEWFGSGVQNKNYGLENGNKIFALFNVDRWSSTPPPECCSVVPIVYRGGFSLENLDIVMNSLNANGSYYDKNTDPEGLIVWRYASRTYMKHTFEFSKGKWNEEK